jgi:hypothetical protein
MQRLPALPVCRDRRLELIASVLPPGKTVREVLTLEQLRAMQLRVACGSLRLVAGVSSPWLGGGGPQGPPRGGRRRAQDQNRSSRCSSP